MPEVKMAHPKADAPEALRTIASGLLPGSVVPIPPAPPLDPSDLAHVPRWLDELREVEHVARTRPWLPGASLCQDRYAGRDARRLAERGPR